MFPNGQDFKQILNNYSLGEFICAEKVIRRAEHLQNVFKLTTESGVYFLKIYHHFSLNIKGGLELVDFLYKKDFPALKVFTTKEGKPYLQYNNQWLAIFEWMDYPPNQSLSQLEAYDFGKQLASFHLLAKDFIIDGNNLHYITIDYLDELVDTHYNLLTEYLAVIEFTKKEVELLNPPSDQPRGICHKEYSLEHVRFNQQKVIKIIDWDLAGNDYFIFDIALLIGEAMVNDILDFKLLKTILGGYESVRKLTTWEKEHLYQSQIYGAFKYLIWELSPGEVRELGFNAQSLKTIKYLKELGEIEYYDKLGDF